MIDVKQLIDEAIKDASSSQQVNEERDTTVINIASNPDILKFVAQCEGRNTKKVTFEGRGVSYTVEDDFEFTVKPHFLSGLYATGKQLIAKVNAVKDGDNKKCTLMMYADKSFNLKVEVK